MFFVKYNDPLYVKLEKLDIIIRLTSEVNMIQVLSELKEYAHEVDVDFVRKSVRAIGRCAIKVGASADRSDILFLKHGSSILIQSSNPVCGFSMLEQVRLCAVWPTENCLGSSMNHIHGRMTV